MSRALGLPIGLCLTVFLSACLWLCPLANVLHAQSEEFGKWQSLFNGKDTTGWRNAKGDQDKPCGWVVDSDGLTNVGGKRIDVSTEKEFGNYELEIEYKVPKGGNSGVYLRGQVEVQILDNWEGGKPVADDKLSPGHSGGIYGAAPPKTNPQKEPPAWNRFRIRHIGDRVTVWHNDVLVQDSVVAEPTPGRMKEKSPTGPVMVQGDHSDVWYRNIRIRPIACASDGWVPVWNGKDLTGFRTDENLKLEEFWGIDVKARAFTNLGTGGGGKDLWTVKPYGNFLVHYEYRSGRKEGGNSGFYLRDQWEIQILSGQDTTNPHTDGSLYSIHPPAQKARNAPEEWNHMDVKVDGVKIWVWQNGKLIHDGAVCKTRTDNHGVATPKFSKAPFKFQGDHGDVWFTNLWIKELPDTP